MRFNLSCHELKPESIKMYYIKSTYNGNVTCREVRQHKHRDDNKEREA